MERPGGGLSVGDINGKIGGEERGLQDKAPEATTSPGDEAIGKKAAKGVKSGNGKTTAVKRAR
jgi:Mn-containing catalase